jgi:hypothetical protein
VARVGARLEFGFGKPARNGAESERGAWPDLEHAIHLYLLNRGVLLTPFHNMMLCSRRDHDRACRHAAQASACCLREVGSHLEQSSVTAAIQLAGSAELAAFLRAHPDIQAVQIMITDPRRAARQGGPSIELNGFSTPAGKSRVYPRFGHHRQRCRRHRPGMGHG